jgi:RNA-directed DNA polymerase
MKTINKFNALAVSPHIESWSLIDWKKTYKYVKKLRQRIFRAERLGQKRAVGLPTYPTSNQFQL